MDFDEAGVRDASGQRSMALNPIRDVSQSDPS